MAKSLLTQDPDATPVQEFELVIALKDFYAQDADPGAVGTGSVWKNTTAAPYLWYERNDANDGWDAFVRVTALATAADYADVSTTATAVDGGAIASSFAEATGDGSASSQLDAITVTGEALVYQVAVTVDGVADAHASASATGTGTADTTATSTTVSGDATSGIKAIRDAVEASVLVDSTGTNARVRAVATDISAVATDALVLTGTGSLALNTDGVMALNPLGNLNLGGASINLGPVVNGVDLPTVDPAVAGNLWVDPAAAFVVKVSQG